MATSTGPLHIVIIIITASIMTSNALIGYDCGGQHMNTTTISLLSTGACDLKKEIPKKESVYIQLLQLSEYNYAEVMQCKVEITRTVYYCGMHSHVSIVRNGEASYIEETLYERCKEMHRSGVIHLAFQEDSIITGLKVNRTGSHSITLVGTLNGDGVCKGANYQDPYGSWENVVVQGFAKVSLQSAYVPVNINTGKVILKSGFACDLADGFCIDPEHGYSFWKVIPTSTCDFHQYDVLYEGPSIKMKDETRNTNQASVYTLTTDEITFALSTSRIQPVCGYNLHLTEHPKLFIVETTKDNVPKVKGDIPVDNLDIFTYVNSKFVYVERHLRTQMTALYHNVIQQRCELEAEVLRNTLSLATLLPDEFAYRLMRGPGYMAVTAGEAIHVIKCIPVEVMVRKTKECYQELPVTLRNSSLFLTPKSHILTKVGMERECTHELPTLYRIEDVWAQFFPEGHVYPVPPQELQPMTRISWKYMTPGPLADSGIYSNQDINKLREHIMFPAEKPALLNSVARGLNGYTSGGRRIPLQHLLDEDALEQIAQSTAARLWGGFVTFGSATAGVLGIFIIIRVIKIIIDTAIHGYALHTVYGCGIHLLGAMWSSLTHLLLHLAHPPPQKGKKERKAAETLTDNDLEMTTTDKQPNNPATSSAGPSNAPKPPSYEYQILSKRMDEIEKLNP